MDSVMTEENTATQEFVDNSPEAVADREEAAKIEAAQAELDAEQAEAQPKVCCGRVPATDAAVTERTSEPPAVEGKGGGRTS